jgi:hypothetical protein
MNELTTIEARPLDAYRMSTDAAGICRDIVVATASTIQGRKFVSVEGWQAIALAHGCVAGSRDVERIDGGVRAIGEVRRMSDGGLIATAEGFVGEDETTWFGGKDKRGKVHDKRNDYAIRAMAQTRAISRACRSAFAHVVVMMKANLQTTPAEEVPHEGFDRDTGEIIETHSGPAPRTKLDGPYTSKTALKSAIHTVANGVISAKSVEEIDNAMKAGKDAIKQAARDWPELLDGDPALEGDDEGLKRLVARRRAELSTPAETLEYQLLVSTLNECESWQELQTWLTKNGDVVGSLDGEESRKFEALYDAKAAALKMVAQASC